MAEIQYPTLTLQQSLAIYAALQVQPDILNLVNELAKTDEKWKPWVQKTKEAYDRLFKVYQEFRSPDAPPRP